MPHPEPIKIGFLLIEDFSMICIATMINPFRSANRSLGYQAYDWTFVSHDGKPVSASDGFEAPVATSIATPLRFDYFFVCAGMEFSPAYQSRLNAALRRQQEHCAVFGSLCTGAFILARAGLLEGYDFTLHWENLAAFAEEFPELQPSQNLYVIDRDRWTGSGGLSSMDIALQIIQMEHGPALANGVGNQYQIDRLRSGETSQRPADLGEYETLPGRLQQAVQIMQNHMEQPLPVPAIARELSTTVRSLERLAKKHLGASPAAFYRNLRLEKARQLLWHTNISILEIAFITGFSSPSYLSRMYLAHFGKVPSQERKQK